MRSVARFLALAAIAAIAAAAEAATHTVDVGPGMFFNPAALSVEEGDTVVWNFLEPLHTTTSDATSGPETWNSGIVASGGTFSHVFSTVGAHPYHCAVHSFAGGTFMNGVITVTAPPPPPAPVLATVSPSSGPTAGGTVVTLGGTDFVSDCTASFDAVAATTTFVDAGTLQATTPPHVAATVDVAVNCSTGDSTRAGAFTYADTLVLTSITPSSSFAGADVLLEGSNFDPAIVVDFDGMAVAVTFIDSMTLRVTVPAIGPGPVTITAANPTGAPAAIAFTVLAPQVAEIPLFSHLRLLALATALAMAGWLAVRRM